METPPLEMLSTNEISEGFWYREGQFENPGRKASDFLCPDDEDLIDNPSEKDCPEPPIPFQGALEYQQILLEAYFTGVGVGDSVSFKLNKVKGIAKDWRDCAYIYNFCVTHNCQSDSKGNDLLELIRALCLNHSITLPLHKDWRSLQRAVEARLKDLHTIYRHSWHLPAPLFGTADSRQVELKPVTAVSYDIMKTMCLQVLYIDRHDFAAGPPARQFPRVGVGAGAGEVAGAGVGVGVGVDVGG